MNLAGAAIDQEQSAGDEDDVARRELPAEHLEHGRGKLCDPNNAGQQRQPRCQSKHKANLARSRLTMLRQSARQNRNQDNVVDTEDYLDCDQRQQRCPDLRMARPLHVSLLPPAGLTTPLANEPV